VLVMYTMQDTLPRASMLKKTKSTTTVLGTRLNFPSTVPTSPQVGPQQIR
jgi:hypothetical protein